MTTDCQICYVSMEDKARKYPLLTVPKLRSTVAAAYSSAKALAETLGVFQPWLAQADLELRLEPRLAKGDEEVLSALHELMRDGRYYYREEPCDCVQLPARTIGDGGDCDQWAVVGAVAAWLLGFPVVYLVGVGTEEDRYMHVYLMVGGFDNEDNFRYWALDPKGDQEGLSFDNRPGAEWVHTPHVLYQVEDRPEGRIAGGAAKMA